ncbi:DUF1445-domain-containing protein [Aspergillus crustosus]
MSPTATAPPGPRSTAQEIRLLARNNKLTSNTSGLAQAHLQANLLVLPSRYAHDFRLLCARNPVTCPLIAESTTVGHYNSLKSHLPTHSSVNASNDPSLHHDIDIRRDIPRYNVYQNSTLTKSHVPDIIPEWTPDHIAFLIGCSFSFEAALTAADLPPLHTLQGRNVAMYRTNTPLAPAGVFTGGTAVVSMRAYKRSQVELVRQITRAYVATHGEPLAWGWDALGLLGIRDIDCPEWGDAPLGLSGGLLGQERRSDTNVDGEEDELVPVFWGCGVTPQEAVMGARLEGCVMAHAPGHMLVLDWGVQDVIGSEG